MKLVLGTLRRVDPTTSARILTLKGFSHKFSPDGINSTFLSQGCILELSSHCGNCGQSICFKDGGGSRESLITQVQLWGQQAVTSFL